ncbi:MAG: aromatic ring-hydroxylating dioxygenase subunit alpha [Pseudomonadota bacterium]
MITNIATQVDDTPQLLAEMVAAQRQKPGYAMDAYFYRSHITYQNELQRLLLRSWIYVAHVSEVSNTGDYVLFEMGEDSIIITRDQQGEIRGLQNICRHRGSRVCEATSGRRKTFVCPYHGWSYNLDGSLRPPRDMEVLEGFDRTEFNLLPVAVEVVNGLIFINADLNAASISNALESIAQPLGAYQLENAKIAHQQTYQVNANWKLCLENYLECYHCATAHRNYARSHTLKELSCNVADINQAMLARTEEETGVPGIASEYERVYQDAEFGCCAGHTRYALYDGYLTGSEDGRAVAPLMGNIRGFDGGAGDFQMGPVSFMLNYPDHCVLYRFIPRGIEQTDMSVVWFVNGDAEEGVDYSIDKLTWLWHTTTLEDEYIIMRNSKGVNSSFFRPGPYHPEHEYLCLKFVEWYVHNISPQSGMEDKQL